MSLPCPEGPQRAGAVPGVVVQLQAVQALHVGEGLGLHAAQSIVVQLEPLQALLQASEGPDLDRPYLTVRELQPHELWNLPEMNRLMTNR